MNKFLSPFIIIIFVFDLMSAQTVGTPDMSFGPLGLRNILPLPLEILPYTDNSFLVKGFDYPGLTFWEYWKHKPDGAIDSTYGVEGRYVTPVKNGERFEVLDENRIAVLEYEVIDTTNNYGDLRIGIMNTGFEVDSSWGVYGFRRARCFSQASLASYFL